MKAKLIILLLCISSFSYSQIVKSIGLKSGITLSNQYWDDNNLGPYYNINAAPGFYGVLTADFINKEHWEIMTDIGFYKSASKVVYNPYTFSYYPNESAMRDNWFRFGFFTFSPVFKLKTQINKFTPYIFIGPRVDYYFSDFSNQLVNTLFTNVTKKPIWGFNIGEGVCYRIKRFSIIAEYKFLYSFNYIIDIPSIYRYTEVKNDRLKTTTHVISLGLKYHLTKD